MTNIPLATPHPDARPGGRWSLPVATAAIALTTLSALLVGGCDNGGAAVTAPPEPEAPLPVQRFERIVKDLKESLQVDSRAPKRAPGGPGGPSTEWSYKLEDKLIKPQNSNDNYRGVITITTESTITVFSRADEPAEGEAEKDQGSSPLSAADEGEEAEEGASTSADPSEGGAALRSSSPIKTHESDDVDRFQLEYVDNRWRLLNPPAQESALETMFEHALDLQ